MNPCLDSLYKVWKKISDQIYQIMPFLKKERRKKKTLKKNNEQENGRIVRLCPFL